MTGLGVIVLVLVGISLLPAFLVIQLVLSEVHLHFLRRREPVSTASYLRPLVLEEVGAISRLAYRHQSMRRPVVVSDLAEQVRHLADRPNFITPDDYVRGAFDYTVSVHPERLRKPTFNMGGFAEVPIIFSDRAGTCFMIRSKIWLN